MSFSDRIGEAGWITCKQSYSPGGWALDPVDYPKDVQWGMGEFYMDIGFLEDAGALFPGNGVALLVRHCDCVARDCKSTWSGRYIPDRVVLVRNYRDQNWIVRG